MDGLRRVVERYRWLWRAQLRWKPLPIWLAIPRFCLRVAADLISGLVVPQGRAPMFEHFTPLRLVGASPRVIPFATVMVVAVVAAATEFRRGGENTPSLETPPVLVTASRLRVGGTEPLPWVFTGDVDREVAASLDAQLDTWFKTLSPEEARRFTDAWDDDPWQGLMVRTTPPGEIPMRAVRVSLSRGLPNPTVWPRILNPDEVVAEVTRVYPHGGAAEKMEGTVGVQWLVDEQGAVLRTRVIQPSRYPELDRAALVVAGVYRFAPASHEDRAVAAWVTGPVSFRLAH